MGVSDRGPVGSGRPAPDGAAGQVGRPGGGRDRRGRRHAPPGGARAASSDEGRQAGAPRSPDARGEAEGGRTRRGAAVGWGGRGRVPIPAALSTKCPPCASDPARCGGVTTTAPRPALATVAARGADRDRGDQVRSDRRSPHATGTGAMLGGTATTPDDPPYRHPAATPARRARPPGGGGRRRGAAGSVGADRPRGPPPQSSSSRDATPTRAPGRPGRDGRRFRLPRHRRRRSRTPGTRPARAVPRRPARRAGGGS
jgi:hypothetical protein